MLTEWQFADELFECVWPFCEIGTKRVINGKNEINTEVRPKCILVKYEFVLAWEIFF